MNDNQIQQIKALAEDIKKQGYHSVCFWMPCYNVSGGSRYLCNLAVELSKHTDLKIYYADYKGGYPSQILEGTTGVEIVEFKDDDLVFPIKEPTIIFTNSTKVIQIKKMNPKSKVLFWHFETIPCGWHLLFFNREEQKFIKAVKKHNAIVYHDWSGRDILSNQFNISLENKDYLEMYSNFKTNEHVESLKRDNEINIAWLSRLGAEKIYSLINIIDNFAKYKTTKIKRIHIIGDGLYRSVVENHAKRYKSQIQFIFKGTIPHEELDDYLVKNVDAVFAMGMSVVECAALKIPSVVVQLSLRKFNDDAYYWLYNTKEYCVGITTDEKSRFDAVSSSMEDILDAISDKENQRQVGLKCYDYFVKYFNNFGDIVVKFMGYLKQCSLTYKEIRKICKYTPYSCVEQIDCNIKKLRFYRRTKFANKLRYYVFGILLFNISLNKNNKYSRWGLFGLPAILPCLIRKRYVPVDNKSIEERSIRIFGKTFIKISKTKIIEKYKLFGKIPLFTKRHNVGYTFPTSQFKG